MKIKLAVVLIAVGLVVGFLWLKRDNKTLAPTNNIVQNAPSDDISVIRQFMGKPDLELSSVGTDLPVSYFRVGKVTKVGTGENMEKVDG